MAELTGMSREAAAMSEVATVEAPTKLLAWHFLRDDGRMRDGTRVEVGKTYRFEGDLVFCKQGYHYSERALDALHYAPGSLVCRVEVSGEILPDADKGVASERTVLWMADATRTLHEFAAWAADWILDRLEAKGYKIDPRSRAAPEAKRAWLRGEITDEQLDAASDAAWEVSRDADWNAARDAAWAVAWAAARDAAWEVARDVAWDAAWDELNSKLTEMLEALAP